MARCFVTEEGFKKLSAELKDLLEVQRPQVRQDVKTAREFGDLRENAEYETARRDHSRIEGRIHDLEEFLSDVEVVEKIENPKKADFGVFVTVQNLDVATPDKEYLLVSAQEAPLEDYYLSIESPLGNALIGAKVGATVTFEAPAGTRRFKVKGIR